ncbi:MAG: zinc-finger domain-containing protein [Alphaproteobacteria bacterium]|nr:zinc-finger domain-containing protein [Alphaproteobacteria bacterium]
MPPSSQPNLHQYMDLAANSAKPAAAIFTVSNPRFACDGGGGALGHPKIYLDLTRTGRVDCPYCGRRFAFSGKHEE